MLLEAQHQIEGMLLTLEGIEFGKVEHSILDGYNEILPGAFEIIFHLFAAKCGRCVNAAFFRVVGMVVLLERGIRSKWYSLEWTRRIVAEKSSNMTQLVLFALRRSREAIGGAKAALKAAYKGTFALRLSKLGQLYVANTINVVHT